MRFEFFFAFLQKLYIYDTYGVYTCYFCNSNIRTATQFQGVRLFHDVRVRKAGRQTVFLIGCYSHSCLATLTLVFSS